MDAHRDQKGNSIWENKRFSLLGEQNPSEPDRKEEAGWYGESSFWHLESEQ